MALENIIQMSENIVYQYYYARKLYTLVLWFSSNERGQFGTVNNNLEAVIPASG